MDHYPKGYFGVYYKSQSTNVWCSLCGGSHYDEECYYFEGDSYFYQNDPYIQPNKDWSTFPPQEAITHYKPQPIFEPTSINKAAERLLKTEEEQEDIDTTTSEGLESEPETTALSMQHPEHHDDMLHTHNPAFLHEIMEEIDEVTIKEIAAVEEIPPEKFESINR
ncbi:hypothetical protein L1987_20911 [Smallanthus sonchifolius]|uniref:Uncharacterized protein n=1 Tax=Smallanthus sonchifolius TaxID=185202 RepID=A0ACB9ISI9_9ASTR|nr:hypothetical protein L1987_20911 [Smallanthus sonchifolius]